MWDTIQKLEYRVRANIEGAQQELNMRLTDRMELPLLGLNGEKLYLTGVADSFFCGSLLFCVSASLL